MSSVYQQIAELAYKRSLTTKSRHRMSEQIAQELIEEAGDGAYTYCLEKLANNTQNPALWRDVLTFLDEMKGNKNET